MAVPRVNNKRESVLLEGSIEVAGHGLHHPPVTITVARRDTFYALLCL